MTNDQMKPGRFLRWQQARRTGAAITSHLESGGRVVVSTYTRATVYSRQHAAMFRATRSGLYVRSGKRLGLHRYCALRFV